jgi:hypothetical protein
LFHYIGYLGRWRGGHARYVYGKWRSSRVRKLQKNRHFNYMQQLISTHHCYYRFRYTTALQQGFLQGGIAALQNLDDRGWVAGSDANVFVSNHDTERVRHHHHFSIMGFNLAWPRTLTPSMRTRLQIPTYWPPSSPCMFLHCPSSVQGHVSHDICLSIFAQRSSIRHTFCTIELQQFLQHRRWSTERRYGLCIFPLPIPPT